MTPTTGPTGPIIPIASSEAPDARLLLRRIEDLPTLSTVAVRLLELTADDDADAARVIHLVSSDPALASRVLRVCRCSPRGRTSRVASVDRAVLLLGFDAVRSIVLSLHVVDALGASGGPAAVAGGPFDAALLWRHSIATALLARDLAERARTRGGAGLAPGAAFVAGLLHDLGVLALRHVAPATVDDVARRAPPAAASPSTGNSRRSSARSAGSSASRPRPCPTGPAGR